MEKNAALTDLTENVDALRLAESNVRHCVAVARSTGASWAEIGSLLGTTRQAAQQRYADAKPNTYRCNCGWTHVIPVDPEGINRETQIVLAHIRTEHPEAATQRTPA